jgi:hypothetical protein
MTTQPSPKDTLRAALAPVLEAVAGLDLDDPAAARAALAHRFPLDGADLASVRAQVEQGLEEGWLVPRENGAIRFGRVAKATPETHDTVIDAVLMHGPGPGHTHPAGEVDLCFALDGAPTFDGNPPGWTVYGPDSWHVPTVSGGTMVILYFLPGGAIRFGPRPS